jgi:hypothetical protein
MMAYISYILEDPNCTKPGCPFISKAFPGICTIRNKSQALRACVDTKQQQSGVLSYDEILQIKSRNNLEAIYDKEAGRLLQTHLWVGSLNLRWVTL